MPSGPMGINGYSISANAPVVRTDPSDVERALRDVNDAYKERIAALTAQRDRLLRYVRARQWMIEGWVAELDDEEFARRSHEADEAWEALRGAGDLDVDGSKSRE